ncbi:MAG: 23S rRNA (adenine(2503)-C(2))-methyltransferase RlmN [Campylobacterales bacterium]
MKEYIYDLTLDELKTKVKPAFRAKQIYSWIYQKYVDSFEEMKNISKKDRDIYEEQFYFDKVWIDTKSVSKDGSVKYLFKTEDGHSFEAVLLLMKEEIVEDGEIRSEARYTLCLSTQIGCKIGCAFCLTAKGGFVRDLSPGEIVYQIVAIKKDIGLQPKKAVNIVYMGMGEPLDNLDNLERAIKIINTTEGLDISSRRQTISTSGLAKKIVELGQRDLKVNLAISLHAVDDELRDRLMPINRAYNIESIIKAIKEFPVDRRKRVMFEYLMIEGLNDTRESAKKLVRLLNGIRAKVNLIYFNPYSGSEFGRPAKNAMEEFRDFVQSKGVTCTIRESRGLDIEAACGQLREKELKSGS